MPRPANHAVHHSAGDAMAWSRDASGPQGLSRSLIPLILPGFGCIDNVMFLKRLQLSALLAIATGTCGFGQELGLKEYLLRLRTAPGTTVEQKIDFLQGMGVSLSANGLIELDAASRRTKLATPAPLASPQLRSSDGANRFLGEVNANRYDADSIANPYGRFGSPYSPDSVNNPYGQYGSPYSPYSANNPYTNQAPKIVTPGGGYLGRYSANQFDAESTSNRFGRYGSPYSSESINNPFGQFGNPYSPGSATNPYGNSGMRPSLPALPTLPALPALPSLPRTPQSPRR